MTIFFFKKMMISYKPLFLWFICEEWKLYFFAYSIPGLKWNLRFHLLYFTYQHIYPKPIETSFGEINPTLVNSQSR